MTHAYPTHARYTEPPETHGMALALSEQMTHGAAQGLAFEERLALLLDREDSAPRQPAHDAPGAARAI